MRKEDIIETLTAEIKELNTPEIGLKPDGKKNTTQRRKEATLKKVGSTEMWFRGEMDHRCCRGEEAVVLEKGERKRSTQGNTKGECFPKAIGLENKRR